MTHPPAHYRSHPGEMLQRRRRLVCLVPDEQLSPWQELGIGAPAGHTLECVGLTHVHEWNSGTQELHTDCVIVDLDAIAKTQPLDDWALMAWRNTFNEFIVRCTNPDGSSPLLLGFTREPTWDSAWIGVRVGTRDAVRLSKLQTRISELFPAQQQNVESTTDRAQQFADQDVNKVTELRPREAPRTQSSVMGAPSHAIPKHAIPFPIEGLEGSSAAIEGVRNLIRKSAPLETPVLIVGPTGSGKELVARAIHRYSPRARGPFVAVNCGAIAPGLIEAELFGHTKGAFTGAAQERIGLLAAANQGTLFLDEVSELPPEFQVKFLRALQDRIISPVGSSRSVPIDIRVVSATKDKLDDLHHTGRFREDLLFRLRVMEITLPSLQERKADIVDITHTLLKKVARRNKRPLLSLSEAVVEKLLLHTWPGNIRELENTLEHAATLCWAETRDQLELDDLPESVRFATMKSSSEGHLKEIVHRFEREYIASTIRRLGGSKEQAADVLGLSLATLYRKLGNY